MTQKYHVKCNGFPTNSITCLSLTLSTNAKLGLMNYS